VLTKKSLQNEHVEAIGNPLTFFFVDHCLPFLGAQPIDPD
jgi:hypothetical protein